MSGDETHSVKRHLDVDAESYDAQIRRFIPHYDDMLATSVELLAALAPADTQVLDLGGGTGALSAAVLEGLPGVRVTVLDVDPDMLGEARRRLVGYGDRVAFHEGQLFRPAARRGRRRRLVDAAPRTTSRPRPSSTAQSATRSRPPECCSTSTPR